MMKTNHHFETMPRNIERFQHVKAQDLLDVLNKPGGEEALSRMGWDTKELRQAAEKSLQIRERVK